MDLKKGQRLGLLMVMILVAALVASPLGVAAEVSVTRDLPDTPVPPEEDVTVSLTQSGFLAGNVGFVVERIPEGFTYIEGSGRDNEGDWVNLFYNQTTKELTLDFARTKNATTLSYIVKAGTAEQIEAAVFSGRWTTWRSIYNLEEISGEVIGDTNLTVGAPTPPPTGGGGNGGGGGGSGGGGGTTPTPPLSPSPSASWSASPGLTPTPVVSPTSSPGVTPAGTPTGSSTPTGSPPKGIPGFEVGYVIGGLLAAAYVILRLDRGRRA